MRECYGFMRRKRKIMFPKTLQHSLTAIILLLAAIPAAASTSLHPLVETVTSLYGGTPRISSIETIEMSGTVTDHLTSREGPFALSAARSGKRLRMEMFVTLSSSGEVLIVGKGKGWRNNRTSFVELSPAELREALPLWYLYLFPASLLDPGTALSYDDLVTRGNRPVELYRLTLPEGPVLTIASDPVSRLVTSVEWHDARDAHISWHFDDFRFVDGILFPFALTRRVDDIISRTVRIGSIRLNRSFPAGTFAP